MSIAFDGDTTALATGSYGVHPAVVRRIGEAELDRGRLLVGQGGDAIASHDLPTLGQ